jgi:hypothetical protein
MLTEVFNAPCACPNTLSESNHGGLHEKGEGRNGGGRDTAEEFRMQAAKATVECGVPTWLAVFFFFRSFLMVAGLSCACLLALYGMVISGLIALITRLF